MVVAWERLFRGLLHGRLLLLFAVQRPGGALFLSVPTLVVLAHRCPDLEEALGIEAGHLGDAIRCV